MGDLTRAEANPEAIGDRTFAAVHQKPNCKGSCLMERKSQHSKKAVTALQESSSPKARHQVHRAMGGNPTSGSYAQPGTPLAIRAANRPLQLSVLQQKG